MKWLQDLLTEQDGTTPCTVRIAAVLGSLTGLGLAIFDVTYHGAHFDVQSYGIGLGAMLGGVGAALKLKPESP